LQADQIIVIEIFSESQARDDDLGDINEEQQPRRNASDSDSVDEEELDDVLADY
jgi:hypothetical protein